MIALDSRERTTALTPRSLPRKLNPEFRWLPEDPSVQIQKVQCINCENYGPHGAGAAFHPSRMDKHLQECAPYIEKCGGVIPPRPEGPKSRKRTNGASASGEEDLEGLGQEYRLLEELEREGNGGAFGERHRIIEMPSADLKAIADADASLVLPSFTAADAWTLGTLLRQRLLSIPKPVVISISLAASNQLLFHTCTHSGTTPDNEVWIARKRKTVCRFGVSTWYLHCKFRGDERAFAHKYGLGEEAGSYAIHGGGVPLRVQGVEGVVAVVVVSGLKQEEDHGAIMEVIQSNWVM